MVPHVRWGMIYNHKTKLSLKENYPHPHPNILMFFFFGRQEPALAHDRMGISSRLQSLSSSSPEWRLPQGEMAAMVDQTWRMLEV